MNKKIYKIFDTKLIRINETEQKLLHKETQSMIIMYNCSQSTTFKCALKLLDFYGMENDEN